MKKSIFNAFAVLALMGGVVFAQQESPAVPEISAPQEEVAAAEEKPWSIEIGLQVDSKYVSDGMVGNPDPIFTDSIQFNYGGFYANLTRIIDLTSYNGKDTGYNHDRQFQCEEMDWLVGYVHTIEGIAGIGDLSLELNIGYNDYQGMTDIPDEDIPAAFIITLDNILDSEDLVLSPYAEFDYDLRHSDVYGQFGFTLSKAVSEDVTLSLENNWYWGSTHHNRDAYDYDRNAINATELVLTAEVALGEYATLSPYVAMSIPVRDEVRQCWKDDENNSKTNFWCGVALSFAF